MSSACAICCKISCTTVTNVLDNQLVVCNCAVVPLPRDTLVIVRRPSFDGAIHSTRTVTTTSALSSYPYSLCYVLEAQGTLTPFRSPHYRAFDLAFSTEIRHDPSTQYLYRTI